MTIPAGMMVNRVRFERRADLVDDFGNTKSAWAELVTVWAAFEPQAGREVVAAGRLESTTRGTMTVRRSSLSVPLQASDRAVFTAGPFAGRAMQIRSIVPGPDNARYQIVLEEGVAP